MDDIKMKVVIDEKAINGRSKKVIDYLRNKNPSLNLCKKMIAWARSKAQNDIKIIQI